MKTVTYQSGNEIKTMIIEEESPVTKGGKRAGSGRPRLGWTRKISLTLPDEIWSQIFIDSGFNPDNPEKEKGNISHLLRDIIFEYYRPKK